VPWAQHTTLESCGGSPVKGSEKSLSSTWTLTPELSRTSTGTLKLEATADATGTIAIEKFSGVRDAPVEEWLPPRSHGRTWLSQPGRAG